MALQIVVGIATSGRPAILRETLLQLRRQTRTPDEIVICATRPSDCTQAEQPRVLLSEPGLPRQRNAIIDGAATADIILFLDDDFLPHDDYVAAIERHMQADPQMVVATGKVIADGIGGPGLPVEEARRLLGSARPDDSTETVFSGYGCNMAVRLAPIRARHLRFDERLPLYGWQEDVDFSRRLAQSGRIVRINAAQGVHLGVKLGRGSGVRLGYSQVANPLYLWTKRSGYPLRRAVEHVGRNVAINLARSLRPETYVDRRGRLRGNMLAFCDLVSGRLAPERILDL